MLVHLWSKFQPRDPDTARRQALAVSSWSGQLWTDFPVADESLPRIFDEGSRKLPFIRDLFDYGCSTWNNDDIVLFSNSDIGFAGDASIRVAIACLNHDCGYAFRRDFPRLLRAPDDATLDSGTPYCGTDVFFFRVGWWSAHRTEMPDMLIGREAWDPCLRTVMEISESGRKLGLDHICWHESHGGDGHWGQTGKRFTMRGQIHNLKLAKDFMRINNLDPRSFGIR